MFRSLGHLSRLARAGLVFWRHGLLTPPPALTGSSKAGPGETRPSETGAGPASDLPSPSAKPQAPKGLARALERLGPSYIKLGQALATRSDLIGPARSQELASLHDRMPPFSTASAEAVLRDAFGAQATRLFQPLGPPVAAASIAQVHKATIEEDGEERTVAIKILRPAIEARFRRDLDGLALAAGLAHRFDRRSRRLRPRDVIATLRDSVEAEMDLRREAAAASEFAELTADDPDFRVPRIDWQRTARRVMTSEWIDGIPLNDRPRLMEAGHDLERLGRLVLQCFLRQAIGHGVFHADMHPGNLFADTQGRLAAVDFGIMGRIDAPTRRFLAETLFGFITRDYDRVADVHFEAGFVPRTQSAHAFSLALRTIGEPIWGRPAREVSIARLLTALFETTERFEMELQPSLLMLQKTMVMSEGVARQLDPDISIWDTARPVVEGWISSELGPEARLRDAAETARSLSHVATRAPALFDDLEAAVTRLASAPLPTAQPEEPSTASFWLLAVIAALLTALLAVLVITQL